MQMRLLALGLLFWFANCVTVDPQGNIISKENLKPPVYTLENTAILPEWSDEDKAVPVMLAALPDETPRSFQLEGLPPVGHQGQQASGTAWAAGYLAASFHFRLQGNEAKYLCSPAFIYNKLNGGRNEGIETLDALKLLKYSGCPHIEHMPYIASDYLRQPEARALLDAPRFLIGGFGRIDFADTNQLKAHLLQRKVIIATFRITTNFVKLSSRTWKQPEGFAAGRHTVGIIGYDDENQVFLIQNSVGKSWGRGGLAEIPYAWLVRTTGKAYVLW